jgi:tetratricopeptide (TPR) repeat protein
MLLTIGFLAMMTIETPVVPEAEDLAVIFEDFGVAGRAKGQPELALDFFEMAAELRRSFVPVRRVELARDLTAVALLRYKLYGPDSAVAALKDAVQEWDAAAPGDSQPLAAMETLASLYRDQAMYEDAEPLLMRAIRLREAAAGPDSAELISSVDSLAYVQFGLRRFAEAEPQYKRLLALWQNNAGPDHPMLALTLDKMAEFYAFQQRYAEAEECATQALAIRTRVHVASLNQTGRILLMEAKIAEAEDLYRRAVQIGDLAKSPDETMDPVLRIYSKILRSLERAPEADALDVRIKDALFRRAGREGRRPSPVQ